jgi:hypothetical protein
MDLTYDEIRKGMKPVLEIVPPFGIVAEVDCTRSSQNGTVCFGQSS